MTHIPASHLRTSLAATLTALALATAPALAADCPASQVAKDARTSGETVAKGVTDKVIGMIDLSSKGAAFKGYLLRLRRLVIEPGGVVPWHMHDERAANILILEGRIVEYRSTCKVGILHKTGEVASEFGPGLSHWWRNESKKRVVIISGDLLPPGMPAADAM